MSIRWYGLFLAIFLILPDLVQAQTIGLGEDNVFEFEIRRWRPRFRSELQVGGESIDPEEDLGIPDARDQEYRGFLRFGKWVKVRGSGINFKYEGTKTLERDITFAGVSFPQGATVDSTLDIRHIKGGVEVGVYAFREGVLAVVAEYASFEAEPILSSPEVQAESGKLEVRLLTLGVKGRVYLTPGLSLTVEATGMKKETSGVITDFEGVITYSIGGNLGVSFGYRNLYTKWLKDGRATFRMEGYFFSGLIRI